MNALEIRNLTVDFGDFAIRNLNADIKKGAVTGLVGRNGAGKSTLIKTIMRQQAATGSILYDGKKFADDEVGILTRTACVFDAPHFSLNAKPKKLKSIFAAPISRVQRADVRRAVHKIHPAAGQEDK